MGTYSKNSKFEKIMAPFLKWHSTSYFLESGEEAFHTKTRSGPLEKQHPSFFSEEIISPFSVRFISSLVIDKERRLSWMLKIKLIGNKLVLIWEPSS